MPTPKSIDPWLASDKFPDGAIKLNTRILEPDGENDVPYVLIEGDARSLEWLGQVFLTQAKDEDCGRQFAPRGPGSAFFNKRKAKLGIYIHRLPCVNEAAKKMHRK
jgi:hypothetical protein